MYIWFACLAGPDRVASGAMPEHTNTAGPRLQRWQAGISAE